jgi:MFS family permease
MFAPIQAVFVQEIGGDILDAALASSFFAIAAGFVVLVSGKFADKHRHKQKLVAFGYALTGMGFLMYLHVDSVYTLFAVQIWVGMSQAFTTPAFDALYTANLGSSKKQSSRWGLWEAGNYFSIALGGLVGGLTAKYAGFDALFILMAAICFTSALYLRSVPNKTFR